MSLFSRKKKLAIPPECAGMEIKVQSSACTGEKTIGFLDRASGELKYSELVRTQADIAEFYGKYGLTPPSENK